jgi:hypothetical protein
MSTELILKPVYPSYLVTNLVTSLRIHPSTYIGLSPSLIESIRSFKDYAILIELGLVPDSYTFLLSPYSSFSLSDFKKN